MFVSIHLMMGFPFVHSYSVHLTQYALVECVLIKFEERFQINMFFLIQLFHSKSIESSGLEQYKKYR